MLDTYGTGLASFHKTCDKLGISEIDCTPVPSEILIQVLLLLAGTLSQSAIKNIHASVHAWHIINRFHWSVDNNQLYKVLDAARCMCNYNHMHMVTVADIRTDQDWSEHQVTVIHFFYTKSAQEKGENIFFGTQIDITDPTTTLCAHVHINQSQHGEHLFFYISSSGAHVPLCQSVFLMHMRHANQTAGLDTLSEHAFRIGDTFEYLLRGLSFENVQTLECWASDTFKVYLCKHSQILAPYVQAVFTLHGIVPHVLPPVC